MPSSTNGVELELHQLSTRTTTRCGEGGRERVAVNRQRRRKTTWQMRTLRTHEGKGLPKRNEGETGEQPGKGVPSSCFKQHLSKHALRLLPPINNLCHFSLPLHGGGLPSACNKPSKSLSSSECSCGKKMEEPTNHRIKFK